MSLAAYESLASHMGMNERDQRDALSEYMANGGVNLDPSVTAWCAGVVQAALADAGVEGTGKLNARSYLDWGQPVDQPQQGDIAVFSRGDPNGWQGHVGFFDGYNPDGTIRVLGGNQGDAVSIAAYNPDSLLGFRRAPEPQNALADARGPDFNPNAGPVAGQNALRQPPTPYLDPGMFDVTGMWGDLFRRNA